MIQASLWTICTTYLGYLVLFLVGCVEDFIGKLLRLEQYSHLRIRHGYAPLLNSFDDFFTRKFKNRIDDCFARPSTGVPGPHIELIDVPGKFNRAQSVPQFNNERYLNLGSYNYLNLIKLPPQQAEEVESTVRTAGVSLAVSQGYLAHDLVLNVEALVAEFLGKPAAVVCSMGFATNVSAIEALLDSNSLIISDELNHASIRFASRLCGARVVTFKHNDTTDLERLLRHQISCCRPSKIMVVVEGLYSMEGTLCNLPELVRLREKYKFYLFVDEAHSIGALGIQGGGVCEHFGICPSQVDVLMGTFSKSFGGVGGYIAADHDIVAAIRRTPYAALAEQPLPAVLAQISAAFATMRTPLGLQRMAQLRDNTTQLRKGLRQMGFTVYGDPSSPVVPILIYQLGKLAAFSREMLERKIAVVVVGYPATTLHTARARFCVSAGHSRSDIDRTLQSCDEIGDVLLLKHRHWRATGTA